MCSVVPSASDLAADSHTPFQEKAWKAIKEGLSVLLGLQAFLSGFCCWYSGRLLSLLFLLLVVGCFCCLLFLLFLLGHGVNEEEITLEWRAGEALLQSEGRREDVELSCLFTFLCAKSSPFCVWPTFGTCKTRDSPIDIRDQASETPLSNEFRYVVLVDGDVERTIPVKQVFWVLDMPSQLHHFFIFFPYDLMFAAASRFHAHKENMYCIGLYDKYTSVIYEDGHVTALNFSHCQCSVHGHG